MGAAKGWVDEHGVAEAIEPIAVFDSLEVGVTHIFLTPERRDEQ